MKKWSRKYDRCVNCLETKKRHKGLGLCTACFDRRRAKINQKRKAQRKIRAKRYYEKNKDNPSYLERQYANASKWRKGQVYREYLKKVYAKRRVDRYLKTGWKTHIKKLDNTLTIAFNGKHIKTTVKFTEGYSDLDPIDNYELEYFKKRLQENCYNQ